MEKPLLWTETEMSRTIKEMASLIKPVILLNKKRDRRPRPKYLKLPVLFAEPVAFLRYAFGLYA